LVQRAGSGLATASLITEQTLHDCTVQRGIFLTQHWESIGLHAIDETEDPNRKKVTAWNVKKRYGEDGAEKQM